MDHIPTHGELLRQCGLDLPAGVAHAEDLRKYRERNAQTPPDEWAGVWATRAHREQAHWAHAMTPKYARPLPSRGSAIAPLDEEAEAKVDAIVAEALERKALDEGWAAYESHAAVDKLIEEMRSP